jgi:NADH-quinone oxidoreductase subunit A
MQYAFLPVLLLVLCAIGLAIGLLIVSGLFNPGRPGSVTRMPYESGMDPIHDTHRRFDVRFHLLAIAFLIFDVELLFLYPWAVAVGDGALKAEGGGRRAEVVASGQWPVASDSSSVPHSSLSPLPSPLSPPSNIDAAVAAGRIESRHLVFAGAMTFLLLLTLGFVYDWRKGIFRWR